MDAHGTGPLQAMVPAAPEVSLAAAEQIFDLSILPDVYKKDPSVV
jgi:hypothetical protein